MNKRCIKITWTNDTTSYYESIVACSNALGLTPATVHNYLKNGMGPMGIRFQYYTMTGEEQLLREVMQKDPIVRDN